VADFLAKTMDVDLSCIAVELWIFGGNFLNKDIFGNDLPYPFEQDIEHLRFTYGQIDRHPCDTGMLGCMVKTQRTVVRHRNRHSLATPGQCSHFGAQTNRLYGFSQATVKTCIKQSGCKDHVTLRQQCDCGSRLRPTVVTQPGTGKVHHSVRGVNKHQVKFTRAPLNRVIRQNFIPINPHKRAVECMA